MPSTNNKKSLVLILLTFSAPVALALVLQFFNWKGEIQTHGSTLNNQERGFHFWGLDNPLPGSWQLVYRLDASCQQQCLNSLYAQQQIWQALAADRQRLRPVVLMADTQQLPTIGLLDPGLFVVHTMDKQQQQRSAALANTVYLFDTRGQQVLSYEFSRDRQQSIRQAKALLLDVKQLLKLSRIG